MADPAPKSDPWFRNGLIRRAIGKAIHEEMQADPAIHLFGEGCERKIHYDAPDIERDFPNRVHTLPISEDANNGFAAGAALLGVKPVVDVITADFLYRAMDSLANTLSSLNFVRAKGEPARTILIRAEFLTAGPTTGARPEAALCHLPGLNVAVPSTPRDAYGITKAALHTPGVTVLFEDRMIADAKIREEDRAPLDHIVPLGMAAVRRSHPEARLTIVTYGLMRPAVEEALKGIDAPLDLIDLRTLFPMDWATLRASARKTGRIMIVEPDVRHGGIGAEIVATLTEAEDPPVARRLGGPRVTIPASMALHPQWMPTPAQIAMAVREMVS